MAVAPFARPVLTLQRAAFAGHRRSTMAALLDLEVRRGEIVLLEVTDEEAATALVDLCLGLADPDSGEVAFLGVTWRGLTERERLDRRRMIGVVGETRVWPAHLSVAEGIVLPHLYRAEQPRDEVIAEAATLARHFGLPGLPTERRETTALRVQTRAACVRGFLGSPELTVVQDQAIDEAAELATPLAQRIAMAGERGGATLWITENLGALGARFIHPDRVFRLGDRGLLAARRPT